MPKISQLDPYAPPLPDGTLAIVSVPSGSEYTSYKFDIGTNLPRQALVYAETLTALEALEPDAGEIAFLAQSKREGDFIFDASDLSVQVAADTRQGVYVAPDSDPTGASGAWVRQISGPLFPGWWGAAADDATDDSPPIQAMFDYITTINVSQQVDFRGLEYYIGSGLTLPSTTSYAPIVISGNGATLRTDAAITIFNRLPADQTEATLIIGNCPLHIRDILFSGDQTVGQIGIVLGAVYGAKVEMCHFLSLDQAMDMQFALMTEVTNCRTTNCLTKSFVARLGQWSGAGSTNSQSNSTVFNSCRVFHSSGSESGFELLGTSGCALNNCIVEGNTPVNNVIVDSLGSTVAKGNAILGLHIENNPTNACILADVNSPLVIDRIFPQTTSPVVESTGSQAGLIEIRNMSFTGTFRNTGTTTIWHFGEVGMNPTLDGSWDLTGGFTKPSTDNLIWMSSVFGSAGSFAGLNLYGFTRLQSESWFYDVVQFPNNSNIGVSGGSRNPASIFLGTSLKIGSGIAVNGFRFGFGTLDFGSIGAGATAELTITVSGVSTGNFNHVMASPSISLEAGLVWSAYVSATDTVTVRLANVTAAPIDPGSKSWWAMVVSNA